MTQATDMIESTPLSNASIFRLQMEGLATGALYVIFFVWIHLGASLDMSTTRLAAYFLVGLIAVPLMSALPLVLLRGALAKAVEKQPSAIAFLPFARFALYGLQVLAVWIVTREAYFWAFAGPTPA